MFDLTGLPLRRLVGLDEVLLFLGVQRSVCRTDGRVTFLSATRKSPKKRVCRRLPAELTARLQRYVQTAAGDMKDFHKGRARFFLTKRCVLAVLQAF